MIKRIDFRVRRMVGAMAQRSVILLLVTVVVLTGCKDESGKPKVIRSVDELNAKVAETDLRTNQHKS